MCWQLRFSGVPWAVWGGASCDGAPAFDRHSWQMRCVRGATTPSRSGRRLPLVAHRGPRAPGTHTTPTDHQHAPLPPPSPGPHTQGWRDPPLARAGGGLGAVIPPAGLGTGHGRQLVPRVPPPPPPRVALDRKGPQRQRQKRFGRRWEEVAKAIGGGYCRLQMLLRLALGVRETVAGHRLAALEGGGVPPSNASPPPPAG